MINLVLLLCLSFAVYSYLDPMIRITKKERYKLKKPKKKSKSQLKRDQQLMLVGMTTKEYRRWQIIGAIVTGVVRLLISLDIISSIIYAYIGYLLVDVILTMTALKPAKTLSEQTQQFIGNLSGFLNTGSNITVAVSDASLQLREPLREHVRLAINEAKGNKTLPETIGELSNVLYLPVYDLLGRLIDKGLETGQTQIAFAFESLRSRLQDIEKIILEKANAVGTYLWWLVGMAGLGPISDLFVHLAWNNGFQINHAHPMITIVSSGIDVLLVIGIRKYVRVYCERNDL